MASFSRWTGTQRAFREGRVGKLRQEERAGLGAAEDLSHRARREVGTTRSRVNFFMNKFKKRGFIEYNGSLKHQSLS